MRDASPDVLIPVIRCDGWLERARGLLGRPPPPSGQALWITPCRQVHTFWMRYTIDVVVLDRDCVILAVQTLAPWRIGPWYFRGHSTLEFAAGEAGRLGLSEGKCVELVEYRS